MGVDRCATDRERVHLVGVQAGVDHREPAALAVADEIHPPAEELHGLLQHGDVLLDRPVRGLVGRRQPVDGEKAVQSAVAQRQHLALVTSVVDDRRGDSLERHSRLRQRWSTPTLRVAPTRIRRRFSLAECGHVMS